MSVFGIVGAIVSVISAIYSIYTGIEARNKARAAKAEADAAADRAKGFQLVVEGAAEPAPIVFGRAKIGGIRVHSVVKNNYTYKLIPVGDKFKEFSSARRKDAYNTMDGGEYTERIKSLNSPTIGEKLLQSLHATDAISEQLDY